MAQWQISRALVWEVKVSDVIKQTFHLVTLNAKVSPWTWTLNFVLSIHTSPDPAATCLCSNHKEFPSIFIRKEVHQSSSMLVLRACGWALQDAQAEGPELNHSTSRWVLCQPSDYMRNKNTKHAPWSAASHCRLFDCQGLSFDNLWENPHTLRQWWYTVCRS